MPADPGEVQGGVVGGVDVLVDRLGALLVAALEQKVALKTKHQKQLRKKLSTLEAREKVKKQRSSQGLKATGTFKMSEP